MRLVLVLALAGCFGKPGFSQRDAPGADDDSSCHPSKPSAPGITIMGGVAPLVTMDNSSIGFPDDSSRYPMPNHLNLGVVDLMPSAEGCSAEAKIGLAAFPLYKLSADTGINSPGHSLNRVVSGPAFTLFQVDWMHGFGVSACGGPTEGHGNTSFGMFPDGRVVRNDTFTPTSAALDISQDPPPPSACQCAEAPSATTFAVTSYTALATSQLTALTLGDATMDTAGLPALHTDVDVPGACVRASNGGHLAVRWDLIDGPDPTVFPTRIRSVQSPTQLLTALVYDWVPPGVQPTLTANTTFGLRTHMLLDSTPDGTTCVQMQSRLRAFVNTPALRFDAQLVAYGSTGVFLDQARTYDAPVQVTSSGGTIPTGFTIGIRFPGASAISTSRDADRVVWQRESDGLFFVFFRDPLLGGETITITPEC